jgi:hypothetical protein
VIERSGRFGGVVRPEREPTQEVLDHEFIWDEKNHESNSKHREEKLKETGDGMGEAMP